LARDHASYRRLLDRLFYKAVNGWPDNDTEVEFELQQTASDDRDQVYWSAAIWLIVRNCNSADAAKEKWSAALKFIREFMVENGSTGLAG
jgi:hypothetical protein